MFEKYLKGLKVAGKAKPARDGRAGSGGGKG
jgi:hypothetical protein